MGSDATKQIAMDGTTGTIKAGDKVTINGNKGTIKAGNVTIDGENGTIKAGDKVTIDGKDGKIAAGKVSVDGKDGYVTGLENKIGILTTSQAVVLLQKTNCKNLTKPWIIRLLT